MNLERMPYCRGYCFLEKNISDSYQFPIYFNKYQLDERFLFFSDDLNETCVIKDNGNYFLICGLVIDTYAPYYDMEDIVNNIKNYVYISEKYFLEYLDTLSGRFILIYKYNNDIYFYHDACGMKSSFYFIKNKIIIASHYNLVKEISKQSELSYIASIPTSMKHPFSYGYPGRTTPTKDIFQLTPNTRINVSKLCIERYFPREEINTESNLDSISIFVKQNFLNQLEFTLRKKMSPTVSLTAGYDSRFTLAILKEKLRSLVFFTYKSHEAHNVDMLLSEDIAKIFTLTHKTFCITENDRIAPSFEDFCKSISKNSFYIHNLIVAYKYYLSFNSRSIHIRSNLAEIGRLFYGISASNFSSFDMIKLWGGKNFSVDNAEEVSFAFDDFYITTDFKSIYNYNPNDLFYWEHRMGIWLSQVLIESDPAFDTLILFNNRAVLKKLLSISIDDRRKNTFFLRVINDFLPEMNNIPINPKKWPLN